MAFGIFGFWKVRKSLRKWASAEPAFVRQASLRDPPIFRFLSLTKIKSQRDFIFEVYKKRFEEKTGPRPFGYFLAKKYQEKTRIKITLTG